MMNYVYAVFDTTTGFYGAPFVAANDDNAVRNYLYIYQMPDLAQKLTTELRRVGIWNNETGSLETIDSQCINSALYAFIDRMKELQKKESDEDGETSQA